MSCEIKKKRELSSIAIGHNAICSCKTLCQQLVTQLVHCLYIILLIVMQKDYGGEIKIMICWAWPERAC